MAVEGRNADDSSQARNCLRVAVRGVDVHWLRENWTQPTEVSMMEPKGRALLSARALNHRRCLAAPSWTPVAQQPVVRSICRVERSHSPSLFLQTVSA